MPEPLLPTPETEADGPREAEVATPTTMGYEWVGNDSITTRHEIQNPEVPLEAVFTDRDARLLRAAAERFPDGRYIIEVAGEPGTIIVQSESDEQSTTDQHFSDSKVPLGCVALVVANTGDGCEPGDLDRLWRTAFRVM